MENTTESLTKEIKEYIYKMEFDVVGIADANNEIFNQALPEYQPKNVLEGANSVIVFGKVMPRSIFKMKNHKIPALHRVYHSLYNYLDISAAKLTCFLESLGHYAVMIPSYLPATTRNYETFGLISLKHAAYVAGIGRIAKNGQLINKTYGTLIRLSAVITTATLKQDPIIEEDICLDCNLCIENCPGKAFDENGQFIKRNCLPRTVKHGLNALHPTPDENYIKNLDLIINTMYLEYTIGCFRCLEVCPFNIAPLTLKKG